MPRAGAAAFVALTILLLAAPPPVRAAGVLSNGVATPTSGTTATSFTFSVDYVSTDSPRRPAQLVWAEVAGTTVTLVKVSGQSHEGTWQGSATLPAGTWPVTFHATTSSDPQPAPLAGPIVTVTPAPTPTPTPSPSPTPRPTPQPTPPATPRATPPPTLNPTPPPGATNPPPQAPAASVAQPSEGAGSEGDQRSSLSPEPSDGATGESPGLSRTSAPSSSADQQTEATPKPTATSDEDPQPRPGGLLAPALIVGGTMSIAGAALLARQWAVTRAAGR